MGHRHHRAHVKVSAGFFCGHAELRVGHVGVGLRVGVVVGMGSTPRAGSLPRVQVQVGMDVTGFLCLLLTAGWLLRARC